jgi:hypothetical protein
MAGLAPAIHVVMQENSSKSMYWRNAVDASVKPGMTSYTSRLKDRLAKGEASRLASPPASLAIK